MTRFDISTGPEEIPVWPSIAATQHSGPHFGPGDEHNASSLDSQGMFSQSVAVVPRETIRIPPPGLGGRVPIRYLYPHQPDNFSFATLQKHSRVYCGRRQGCVVYPMTGAQIPESPGREAREATRSIVRAS